MCNFNGMIVTSMVSFALLYFGLIYIVIIGEMKLMFKSPNIAHETDSGVIGKSNGSIHRQHKFSYYTNPPMKGTLHQPKVQQKDEVKPDMKAQPIPSSPTGQSLFKACTTSLDCEFQIDTRKIHLNCNKSFGHCTCEWPEVIEYFETPQWKLLRNERDGKCYISTNGPCGYYKGISIHCGQRNRCIDGFCKVKGREF